MKKADMFLIPTILLLITLAVFVYYYEPEETDLSCKNCNIILISIDTFRLDHLPCLGYYRDTAPNICKIGEYGILFDNFISQNHLTPIIQTSLFTSQYPATSGFNSFFSTLPSNINTLPETIKEGGYRTAAFGSSWEVMGSFYFNETPINLTSSFSRGFDKFEYTGFRNLPTDAFRWIEDNKDEKFFLWLPVGSVHFPYAFWGDPEEKKMFDPKGYDGLFKDVVLDHENILFRIFNGKYYSIPEDYEHYKIPSPDGYIYYPETEEDVINLTKHDFQYIISRYDYGIYYTDNYIKDLWGELFRHGLLENTIVIIHSVHGDDFGEHGYFGHYDIYDTEIRNFLIIYHPKSYAYTRSVTINKQVRGLDLAPTILDLLNMSELPGAQGISLVPIISGKDKSNLTAFIERVPLHEDEITRNVDFITKDYKELLNKWYNNNKTYEDTALRTDEWKLIHRRCREIEEKTSWWLFLANKTVERNEFELYNLIEDPYEQDDVINKYPEIVKKLKEELLLWEKSVDI